MLQEKYKVNCNNCTFLWELSPFNIINSSHNNGINSEKKISNCCGTRSSLCTIQCFHGISKAIFVINIQNFPIPAIAQCKFAKFILSGIPTCDSNTVQTSWFLKIQVLF